MDKLNKALDDIIESLKKRAPKGVDPEKHESCVMDVKAQGHDVGSAHAICTSSMKKDENDALDAKIRAKLKAEMDRRNFGEADATRHVIDRDRGEAAPKMPKEKPLLQSEQEVAKYDHNGQWKIEKSNYGPKGMGQYTPIDNIRRKANRTTEEVAGAGPNKAVHQYSSSGSSTQAAHEANEAKRRKANPAPVKTMKDFSDEELTSITNAANKMNKVEGTPIKPCTSCGEKLHTGNAKYIGEQALPEGYMPGKKMSLYNCPKCDSTVAHLEDKGGKLNKNGQWSIPSSGIPEKTFKKGADSVDVAGLTKSILDGAKTESRQPSNQQMFGHLEVTEQQAKAAEVEWNNKFNSHFNGLNQPIDHLNKSKKDVGAGWGNGKSFNDSLSKEELEERKNFIGE